MERHCIMVDKYQIAEAFFDHLHECDQFINQLPQSVEAAFYENEAYTAKDQLVHILLKSVLGETEHDDLCYFAYEDAPRVEVDNLIFLTLEEYWQYCDSKVTVDFVGGKL